jgi:predicted DNA-binding transcriptional regulator AlpA
MTKRAIRPTETEKKTGYCDRHLRDLERQGLFPRRFKLNPNGRAVAHWEHEVDEWLTSRAASRIAEREVA